MCLTGDVVCRHYIDSCFDIGVMWETHVLSPVTMSSKNPSSSIHLIAVFLKKQPGKLSLVFWTASSQKQHCTYLTNLEACENSSNNIDSVNHCSLWLFARTNHLWLKKVGPITFHHGHCPVRPYTTTSIYALCLLLRIITYRTGAEHITYLTMNVCWRHFPRITYCNSQSEGRQYKSHKVTPQL